jgi:hypothetical protein
MTENRCPNCEALMVELDCLECVWYSQHQTAVRVMGERFGALATPTLSYCVNGHEMTEANTRLDVRIGVRKGNTRTCRACLRQRVIDRRERGRGTAQPREPRELDRGRVAPTGRMTPSTLPVEEQR